MKKLTATRIGTGYYEVATPLGTYRVENIPAPKGSGYGSGPNWLIISPGKEVADASKPTKREAMEYLQRICDEHEERPTLEDVELPSDEADREQAQREAEEGPGRFLVDPHTWLRGRLNKRYVVEELGPNYFVIRDTRTSLDVGTRTSREEADARAAALNFD
ncbi:hypothetical protein AB0I84_18810 [Streptomyces spectabilis]|uniref:hypothetical protein n=1 Tax=Streptomyces spectabilis TaxID=68270 RepID=UPI00340962B6